MNAYYEGLPVFSAAMDLAVRLDSIICGFSRYHKYATGFKIREKAMNAILLVQRCNQRDERARAISQLCNEVEDLKILINIAKEVGAFQLLRQFAQVMEQVVVLARQAEGWKKKNLPQSTRPETSRSVPQSTSNKVRR